MSRLDSPSDFSTNDPKAIFQELNSRLKPGFYWIYRVNGKLQDPVVDLMEKAQTCYFNFLDFDDPDLPEDAFRLSMDIKPKYSSQNFFSMPEDFQRQVLDDIFRLFCRCAAECDLLGLGLGRDQTTFSQEEDGDTGG